MTIEQEIIKKIAKKYGLTQAQVQDIVYSQHEFLAHVMKNEVDRDTLHFPSVRMIGLGIFHCPDKIKYKLQQQLKAKENDTTN